MVRVRVPASTSNLGSGFDCFGLALKLYLNLTLEVIPNNFDVRVSGEGASDLPTDNRNLVLKAVQTLYETLGEPTPGFRVIIDNGIPVSRGLGSSGAAIIGGLVGASALTGSRLSREELLSLASGLEGHPENAASSLFGGLTINCTEKRRVQCKKVDVAETLRAVVLIPEAGVSTEKAREILPKSVAHEDAVFNLQRAALLAHAFTAQDYGALKLAMQDRLHQPYRKTLIAEYEWFEKAAYENGALGVCISGSGSAVLGLALSSAEALKTAWQHVVRKLNLRARVEVFQIDNDGAQVT